MKTPILILSALAIVACSESKTKPVEPPDLRSVRWLEQADVPTFRLAIDRCVRLHTWEGDQAQSCLRAVFDRYSGPSEEWPRID